MSPVLVAVAAAAAAVALGAGGSVAAPRWAVDGSTEGPAGRRAWWRAGPAGASTAGSAVRGIVRVVVVAAVGTVALLVVPGRATVLALVLLAAAGGVVGLAGRRRGRARRRDIAARVQETCELLAAELAAGRPPTSALRRAAGDWPALEPAARAADLGADVPTALRGVAGVPGAGDLSRLAAAWQVSQRTGQGLAEPVARTAAALRQARSTRRVVDSELASARATARLLAGLPVLALLMGSGAGGDPWRFLLATPAGLGCLAAGLGAGLGGLWWIERIAEGVEDRERSP